MKNLRNVCLLVAFMLCTAVANAQEVGMKFVEGTFAEVLAQAKAQNKMVLVDCYTLWCGPCKQMLKNVMPTKEAGDAINPGFVCTKIDMEHGEGPELQKNWKVKAYPTYIVFDADGKEKGRFEGMSDVQTFIKRVQAAAKGEKYEPKPNQAKQDKPAGPLPKIDAKEVKEGKGIKFEHCTFEEALAKAKAENKRIFVDCYTSWCGPCKKLAATVFEDTRVGNVMNQSFICIKVNMEEEEGKPLEKYGVAAYPTMLFINPDGTEHNRMVGGADVPNFLANVIYAQAGIEDEYTVNMRKQKEALKKAHDERIAALTDAPRALPQNAVKWEKTLDIDKALTKAKKTKKNVYILFNDFGENAEYFLQYMLPEKAMADYLNTYVCLHADVYSKAGNALLEKYDYKQESFPYVLILDANGEMIGAMNGAPHTVDAYKESVERNIKYMKEWKAKQKK